MRYKLLLGVFILLIATPLVAQEFSPIVIETGKPVPSVVKSGEPFKITYRAKFLDTVVIYEEQMNLNSLALLQEKGPPGSEVSLAGNAEVVALDISKERVNNDTLGFVNVWDFTYTFRIIHPKKGVFKISPFNFIWVEKKAGVTVEETKDKEKPREFPTREVGINYISSVVKPPPLDIRDEQGFVSPIAEGFVLRRWAYGLIGVWFSLSVLVVFRFFKHSKSGQAQEVSREAGETVDGDIVVDVEPVLSSKQARKQFLKELKKIRRSENELDLVKKPRLLIRTLLLAELRGTIRASMSENEIYAKLSGLDGKHKKQVGWKYVIMLELARRLKVYQNNIDSGICFLNPVAEFTELRELVSCLKSYKAVWYYFKPLRIDEVVR